MARLDQERQERLEPKRVQFALNELSKRGIEVIEHGSTTIRFMWKGEVINFFPYSGWHQGKGIKPGRGIQNLLKQLK